MTGKQGEYERVRGEGQHLLQLAHPQAVAVLQSHLQDLETAWLDLRGRVGGSYHLNGTNFHGILVCIKFFKESKYISKCLSLTRPYAHDRYCVCTCAALAAYDINVVHKAKANNSTTHFLKL